MGSKLLIGMILAPLLGAILNGLVLRSPFSKRAGILASSMALLSFVAAVTAFFRLYSNSALTWSLSWIAVGDFQLGWNFLYDRLTGVMAMLVTGIGFLIHVYSIGYMSEEKNAYRYFSYLGLFLFNMLVLITSDNLVGLFVGWEGVGLCSYLLIGYWFEDPEKAKAGMKAFLVNRIGDAGFLIGIFLCYQVFDTFSLGTINRMVATRSDFSLYLINLACVFLVIGATGKSAQIPLYVWLPDAMAGPTPVSALIHAATMVTAGIYLIVRLWGLFIVASTANTLIVTLGMGTALLAALIATSQNDIKKVLAYSTVSQLGFMFVALGCRAYGAALFHLITHAFFKALLFLGSGSVIHALSGEQDIYQMGGLRKKLPFTFWTFTIGTLAICGIPPLAGFFSKDTILHAALGRSVGLWVLGAFAATLTACYMGRLYALVFLGEYRGKAHPHESPPIMWIPLVILAVGSAFAGFLSIPESFHLGPNILERIIRYAVHAVHVEHTAIPEHLAMAITTALAIGGTSFGIWLFSDLKRAETKLAPLKKIALVCSNKFWVDELYEILFIRPFGWISQFLAKIIDVYVVDGSLMGLGKVANFAGSVVSWIQWGSVQFYLLVMLVGCLLVSLLLLKGLVI